MATVRMPVVIALTAAAAAVSLTAGVVVARAQPSVAIRVADGYASPAQAGVSTKGWSYDVPLDVQWRDATGSWHENGRPDCIPTHGAIHHLRFATVTAKVEGVTWRPVVWVDCQKG
jgi:hypothetical protein